MSKSRNCCFFKAKAKAKQAAPQDEDYIVGLDLLVIDKDKFKKQYPNVEVLYSGDLLLNGPKNNADKQGYMLSVRTDLDHLKLLNGELENESSNILQIDRASRLYQCSTTKPAYRA